MSRKDLIKHSSAIHASGQLSLLERKFVNVLLFHSYDNLLLQRQHKIRISYLCELAGYNSNDDRSAKLVLQKLARTAITWDVLNTDGTSKWGVSSLLASAEIENGVCTYEYSEAMAKQLANPEVYGRISLHIQKTFTSGHSLTVYEICSSYKGILKKRAKAYTKWMSLDSFRVLLGVDSTDYYHDFRRLNERIIKPAVNEINGSTKKYAGTDIFIEPEFNKEGRKISELRFKIISHPQKPIPVEEDARDEMRELEIYTRLVECGMSDKLALHMIKTHTEAYINEKLDLAEAAEKKGSITHSFAGYLKQALDEDYQPPVKTNKARAENEIKADIEERERQAFLRTERELKDQATKILVDEYLEAKTSKEKLALLEEIRDILPSPLKPKSLDTPQAVHLMCERIPNFKEKLKAVMVVLGE